MRSLRSLGATMSATEGCMTIERRAMSKTSLSRSSSVSLVLPLATPPQHSAAVSCTALRRAQSSIPALGHALQAQPEAAARFVKSFQKWVADQDIDLDRCSDCPSVESSDVDYFEAAMDEPQRVSKDMLRSLSTSFRWLEVPFHEYDLPNSDHDCAVDGKASAPLSWRSVPRGDKEEKPQAVVRPRVPDCKEMWSHVYIHECRTGRNVLSHDELKTAMDNLTGWTMLVPRNCCLSYRHGASGEVVTLPWPDLEAGCPDEIEEFVKMVNHVEGKPVFFTRYGRYPYYAMNSVASLTKTLSGSMSAILNSAALESQHLI